MTKPIINPDDFKPEAIARQIAAFEAGGGKTQQIPDGATSGHTADPLRKSDPKLRKRPVMEDYQ